MGLYYTGETKLLRPCTNDVEVKSHKMFFLQWITTQLGRIDMCRKSEELRKNYTNCDAVKDYKLDYIIWDKNVISLDRPNYFKTTNSMIWKNESYELWQVDKPKILNYFCNKEYNQ